MTSFAIERRLSVEATNPEGQEERMRLMHELKPFFAGLPTMLTSPGAVNVKELLHTLERIKFKLQEDNNAWDAQQKPSERKITAVRRLLTEVLTRLEALSEEAAAVAAHIACGKCPSGCPHHCSFISPPSCLSTKPEGVSLPL